MSLEKCRECGTLVSSKAETCPSCGVKSPGNRKIEILLGLVIVFLLVSFIGSLGGGPKPLPESAPLPPPQSAPLPSPKTAAELRMKKIESGFSSWDGSHRALTKLIKGAMNDPDSYEHIKTSYADKGDLLLVKTSFRGKNAFGGKVVNWVIAEASIDGQITRLVEQGP